MSDLCMYELEDIVWDEFDGANDCIVPHPSNEDETETEAAFHGDSCKKPWHEVSGVSTNAGDRFAAKFISKGKTKRNLQTLKNIRNTILEKDSWSDAPESILPATHDSDSTKEMLSLVSDNTRMSCHYIKSSNADIVSGRFCPDCITSAGNNSYNYSLGDISQTDNELSFFDNNRDYGWSDIGNFEDVDRMFRHCDSPFGLGNISNEDELSWFSSSHDVEGSETMLNSDFKFSSSESSPFKNVPGHCETSTQNDASSAVNISNADSGSFDFISGFQLSECPVSAAVGNSTFMNGIDATPKIKDEFKPKDQAKVQKQQSKRPNQSEGKRKDHNLENGNAFHYTGNLQSEEMKLQSRDSSFQVQKQSIGADSYSYLPNHVPYMHLDYGHHSNQFYICSTLPGGSLENNGLTAVSSKEFSYASNQVQPLESSYELSFEAPAVRLDEKRGSLQHGQGLHSSYTSNFNHMNMLDQSTACKRQKQDQDLKNEVGVAIVGILSELDCLHAQESSCTGSSLDDISLEESSFRQLQQVMEKLDRRTKLCMRDSLYRLARSAEQRHHYATLNDSSDGTDACGAGMAEGASKSDSLIDMETNTNPIDRSIAHLLFCRPSDSSVTHATDAFSPKLGLPFNDRFMGLPVLCL